MKTIPFDAPVGLTLVDVSENGTIRWVTIPDDLQDRALSVEEAAQLLLLPAYTQLRAMRSGATG